MLICQFLCIVKLNFNAKSSHFTYYRFYLKPIIQIYNVQYRGLMHLLPKERKEGEDGWREERMEGGKTMTLHLVK